MKDDRVYLEHILESAGKIRRFVASGRDAFFADDMAQDAVVRNLEIIGEATKQLSEGLRAEHPDVPWRAMARMRDRLIHAYFGVREGRPPSRSPQSPTTGKPSPRFLR